MRNHSAEIQFRIIFNRGSKFSFPQRTSYIKKNRFGRSSIVKLGIICIFLSCAHSVFKTTKTIYIRGSDTMLLLTTRWAEKYMQLNPTVAVYAEGGGSALGIEGLIKGDVSICAASRPLRSEEAQLLVKKQGRLGMRFLVAKDAISIFIHPNNPVNTLTMEQLKQIYLGHITNWQQVGGINESIQLYIRSPNSGTFLYFREHVLNDDPYSTHAITMPTTKSIVNAVADHRNAIGYGGIAYGLEIKLCRINDIAPTIANIQNDSYPLIRYLYLYTVDTPKGVTKAFIDWVISDGQAIVKEVGYAPLWENADDNE